MGSSLLATDGYKFSMAEAGWPLREETFYYTHRRGGAQLLPFDVEAVVRGLLPVAKVEDYAYLAAHEYEMGAGFKAAICGGASVVVRAIPKGSWFLPREPVFSVTGPSALVSWLEPLLLQLHFRIQVATVAKTDRGALEEAVRVATCERHKEIVLETLDAVGERAPRIAVDADAYRARVAASARELGGIAGPGRIFEVGLRAATSIEQHLIALEGCRDAGVRRTSHVLGARLLGMTPVGTMGHEHVQRYGSDDAAFRAMRERRPQRSSYLLDTFDTMRSGLPAAFALLREHGPGDSIRYDSGDKEAQYRYATALAAEHAVRPVHILEDSFDAPLTRRFEALRAELGVRPEEQHYGYGGALVASTAGNPFTRDRVSAVYKLSRSGRRATMKFGNEAGAGKESVPGDPVVFRRVSGDGPVGLIGQCGEAPPPGYVLLTRSRGDATGEAGEAARGAAAGPATVEATPATRALAARLRAELAATIEGGAP